MKKRPPSYEELRIRVENLANQNIAALRKNVLLQEDVDMLHDIIAMKNRQIGQLLENIDSLLNPSK